MTVTHVADIVERMELGRQAAVNAEELLVHNGSKGKGAEGLHAGIVDALRVLAFA